MCDNRLKMNCKTDRNFRNWFYFWSISSSPDLPLSNFFSHNGGPQCWIIRRLILTFVFLKSCMLRQQYISVQTTAFSTFRSSSFLEEGKHRTQDFCWLRTQQMMAVNDLMQKKNEQSTTSFFSLCCCFSLTSSSYCLFFLTPAARILHDKSTATDVYVLILILTDIM